LNFRSTVAPEDAPRKLLVAFVFVLIFVAAAYEFSELVLAGDLMGFAYVALLAVGSVFIIAILNNWRNGVYFLFSWLLFEDLAPQISRQPCGRVFCKGYSRRGRLHIFHHRRASKKNSKNCAPAFFRGGDAAGVVRNHADV
jgi:hypothetical protein